MSAKISAARRAAFLKTLGETGNVTLSAERAKVSRSWVLLHRKGDAAFDDACRAALQHARDTLKRRAEDKAGGRGGTRPPSGWGFLDGVELVVRGSGGSGEGRRVQIARARLHQWDARTEDCFLAALAATCNVRAACAQVGLSVPSVYKHRHRWPSFARRWDEAVEIGYIRLDSALLAAGHNLFSAPDLPEEQPIPPMTVSQVIHYLHMHQHQVRGVGRRPGLPPREPSIEEVRDEVLRRLAAMRRARSLGETDKAASERE